MGSAVDDAKCITVLMGVMRIFHWNWIHLFFHQTHKVSLQLGNFWSEAADRLIDR